jgi:copper(I)-binding protein
MWRLLICVSLLLAGNTWAAEGAGGITPGTGGMVVEKAWMRESVPGQNSVTVQCNLSVTKAARVLSVRSPVAKSGEIQSVVMRHGKPQSEVVDSLKLPAHSTTIFSTRGVFLTLVGLTQPLNVGDMVPVTLIIEVAGKNYAIKFQAEVRALELSYEHYLNPNVKDHQ